ncbi:MAG: hypothetical protein ACR2QG_07590, partial [Gammaproteobacteria bacterium]
MLKQLLLRLIPAYLLLLPGILHADAIVRSNAMFASTIAEIYVGDEEVFVDFEVGLNDLPAFANLLPDEIYVQLGNEPVPAAERTPKFFTEDFLLIPDSGQPLSGKIAGMGPVERIQRDAVTGEALP